MKRTTLSLNCQFSDDELAAKAQELSQATIELRDTEEEKAEVSKSYSEHIKELRSRMSGLAKAYKARGETRLVDCIVRMNEPEPLQKTTIRTDTGEIAKVEPMTDEERQQELFEEKEHERGLVDSTVERMLRASEVETTAPENEESDDEESEGSDQ